MAKAIRQSVIEGPREAAHNKDRIIINSIYDIDIIHENGKHLDSFSFKYRGLRNVTFFLRTGIYDLDNFGSLIINTFGSNPHLGCVYNSSQNVAIAKQQRCFKLYSW